MRERHEPPDGLSDDAGPQRVVVLGVGNVLCADDGVGVRVAEELQRAPSLPANVTVLDGGCLGPQLIAAIQDAERLIVVDAVRTGADAGTIHRLQGWHATRFCRPGATAHDLGPLDLLAMWNLTNDTRCDPVIIGVEPEDTSPWIIGLTPKVAARVSEVVEIVLAEIAGTPVVHQLGSSGCLSAASSCGPTPAARVEKREP